MSSSIPHLFDFVQIRSTKRKGLRLKQSKTKRGMPPLFVCFTMDNNNRNYDLVPY